MPLAGAPGVGAASYEPRAMEGTVLHRVVRENFETFRAEIARAPMEVVCHSSSSASSEIS